jgi:hypothetical protein
MNARENIKVPSLKKGQRRTSPKKEVLIPNHGDFFILAGLWWAVNRGQFEDIEVEGERILRND